MSRAASDVEDNPPHSDPRAGARVGSVLDEKWTLERILGSGGMGAVYAARHRNGARGAVKVLHPELARRPEVRERFLREGYAANRVEHRGAVQVLDDDIIKEGPDEGTAYLVMEILEGESLEERIDRGPPLTEPELLVILDDVLAVLEAAHQNGVVHRDLKPANLFLNKDASGHGVKVLDFGLARLAELRSVTSAGLALGTPSFMAPEQASGRQTEIDARSDLFAIGATAFMILADRGVHEADGVIELVARMGTLPAPKLREVAPHVSEAVAAIVDRALEFERENRYQSAAAMRADIVSALASRRSVVAPTSLSGVLASAPNEAALSKTVVPRELPPPAARGGSRAWLVLGLLVAGGVALLIFEPRARESSGVASALGTIMGRGTRPSAGPDAVSSGAPSRAPSELSSAEAANPDAAPAALATEVITAAATEAALDAAPEQDAGADAAADDDDDDDEVDASDLAAIASTRDAGPAAMTTHPVTKRPRVAPGVKRGHPRKPRKQKRR